MAFFPQNSERLLWLDNSMLEMSANNISSFPSLSNLQPKGQQIRYINILFSHPMWWVNYEACILHHFPELPTLIIHWHSWLTNTLLVSFASFLLTSLMSYLGSVLAPKEAICHWDLASGYAFGKIKTKKDVNDFKDLGYGIGVLMSIQKLK